MQIALSSIYPAVNHTPQQAPTATAESRQAGMKKPMIRFSSGKDTFSLTNKGLPSLERIDSPRSRRQQSIQPLDFLNSSLDSDASSNASDQSQDEVYYYTGELRADLTHSGQAESSRHRERQASPLRQSAPAISDTNVTGITDTTLDSLKRENTPEINAFIDHITQGLGLIRAGRFEESIEHFNNKDAVRGIGYTLADPDVIMRNRIPTRPAEIADLIRLYEPRSMCRTDQKRIDLSQIIFMANLQALHANTDAEKKAIKQIRHEEALAHAEEHLHALQDKLGRNISFFEPDTAHDYEIDIATTLANERVPLTERFLYRYGRHNYVNL